MKKVLLVVPSLEQGGGEKFVVDLAAGLDKTQFIVRVLAFYKRTGSVFDRFAEEHGIDVVYLDKQVGLDFPLFAKVRKAVRAFAPDVIHSHLHSMLYLLPLYRRRQVKLHTVHSMAEKEATGMQRRVRQLAFRVCGVKPVAISKTVCKSIATLYGMPEQAVPTVYNGVDCARYDLPRTASDTVRLVSVGRLQSVKNFSFLIDCFSEICRRFERVHLTLVGNGEQRAALEEQVNALGIAEHVTFAGTVSDVERYLADADVYVASSRFEGLPISMLEAMAAGLPIVSTDVGGVSDIVEQEVNGLLVPLNDREAYVKALAEMVQNEQKRKRFSEQSKCLVKQYDESVTVKGYEALYKG